MAEPEAFGVDDVDGLTAYFEEHGFAVLRGAWDEGVLDAIDGACADAQAAVVAGVLPERYGTTILVDDSDDSRMAQFANYVTYATEVVPGLLEALQDPVLVDIVDRWLGPTRWMQEHTRFGVVFQDARPGRESSYTRIGWHSDWQSGPHLDMWPSVAFTVHLDGTSPANGFLRVVPGSHRWSTPAPYRNANDAVVPDGAAEAGGHTTQPPPFEMPLGFEKIPGEIAVYCERGDILFHDAYLWHSAARATDDAAVRRHIRGGWYSGVKLDESREWVDDFVKNAAR